MIPIVIISFESEETYEFSLSFFSTSTPNFIDSFYENLFSDPEQSSIPRTSSIETNLNINEFLKGLNIIAGLFGTAMNIVGLLLSLPPSLTIKDVYKIIIAAFIFGSTLGLFIPFFLTGNKDSPSYLIGMNIGIALVFGIVSFLTVSRKTAIDFTKGFGSYAIFVSILMTLLTYFELLDQTNDSAFIFSLVNILKTAWGIMALMTGAFLIQTVKNPNLVFAIQDSLLIITWITGGFIGGYSKWWMDTHNN